ncbi:DUF1365 domain-containing protein [Marinobacter sp. 71-i]|uniref:DUF1365 domain-containing protein n=1 Tax=Marinobacter iranensis TaxID=2962607 RepID=A0ABT5Y995_9GAMM|nr:DUF1365 domain-containing protein [Marinobacter iranensis]MDF0750253.1 DUF1365 domain-containing protein [Marinobacter iranensis]
MNAAVPDNIIANRLHSQWLEGTIRHRRKAPVRHEFSYSTGMLALDLSEWHSVTRISRLFSLEAFNWLSLRRQDYFRPETNDLLEAVSNQVQQATGWRPDGTVELITHPRYFGYVFNPVSFYFCYNAGDRPANGAVPRVILAQITNTPWKDRHVYCLETTGTEPTTVGWRTERFGFSKRFHVSPFNPMDQQYQWTFSFRGPELRIHMNVLQGERKHFDATLVVRRTPLDRKELHRSLRQFPLEALKVVGGIYWHALKLKLKGVPFFTHPDKLPEDDPAHRLGTEDSGLDVTDAKDRTKTTGKVSSWRT